MALKINRTKMSDTPWGDVDKSALGKKLASAYAAGDVTKAVIREVYAYVPEDAFGKDDAGKPTFSYSKAWGPHHELDGDELVLNVNGLEAAAGALAGARANPSLSTQQKTEARSHLRRNYRQAKLDAPESLKESLEKVQKGTALEVTETVKGSYEYLLQEISSAFSKQFYPKGSSVDWDYRYRICDTFMDHVIVQSWVMDPDEYWYVEYTRDQDNAPVFALPDDWKLVELGYKPSETEVAESLGELKKTGKRLEEVVEARLELLEAASADKPRSVRISGLMEAGVVNGNRRRYSAPVIARAVENLREHLGESAGSGRLKVISGEAEHPNDKGNRGPQFLETLVKWSDVSFDGESFDVAGHLIPTSKGKDAIILMESGVMPGGSIRGYYTADYVQENGVTIEDVTELYITGIDLVGSPSFFNAAELGESQQTPVEEEMDFEKFKAMLAEHPEWLKGLVESDVKNMTESQFKTFEESLRTKLGLKASDDLGKAIQEAFDAKNQMALAETQKAVDAAITESTKDLPYGDLNKDFVSAVQAAKPTSVEAVKAIVESKRKEYDAIVANLKLAAKGFQGVTKIAGIQVVGSVLENETGVPDFARHSFEVVESLERRNVIRHRDLNDTSKLSPAEMFAVEGLKRYDALYKRQLIAEMKQVQEAGELASDLNLPYGVVRAILQAVWPQLVSANVFDFGVVDQAPAKIFYELFAKESGVDGTVTDEALTAPAAAGTWSDLAHKRINPGSVVLTDDDGDPTFVEGTDYVIDYVNGRWMFLTGGGISASDTLEVDYTYEAIRKGENQPIERGKYTLASMTMEIAADRLATQITREAILFSRSQLGWDATARTLSGLINEIRRKIDKGIFYTALTSALRTANNLFGTWDISSDTLDSAVVLFGKARVGLAKRFYQPTAYVLSTTNADLLGNWQGFTQAGQRPGDERMGDGFIGSLKGLPVFHSTEFTDGYGMVVNRELVAHRVYEPMRMYGPYPTYDQATAKLIAAEQYYAEEFNGTDSPLPEKGALVKIQE